MSDEATTSGQSAPAANEEVEKKVEETSTAAEASEAPAAAADDAKPAESEQAAKDNTDKDKKEDPKPENGTRHLFLPSEPLGLKLRLNSAYTSLSSSRN